MHIYLFILRTVSFITWMHKAWWKYPEKLCFFHSDDSYGSEQKAATGLRNDTNCG